MCLDNITTAVHPTEERGVKYAIRIPANDSVVCDIEELLTRPVGRPSHKPIVWYKGFLYQAASWKTARRVVAKVEFHAGELFPRVGFIVTNLETPSRAVVRFYNKRGTAEQWIKEGKQAVKMTRLSCHRFRSNQVRLALSLLAYNLGNLWRRLTLPERIENWSLTSLQQRLSIPPVPAAARSDPDGSQLSTRNLSAEVGARRSVAKVGQNVGPFRAMLVLIETVGAAQMELGSSNAQKAQRVYNAYRFRSQKGNSG
jgi:hypothetical protein